MGKKKIEEVSEDGIVSHDIMIMEGIGTGSAEKLETIGVIDIPTLAVANASDVSHALEKSLVYANELIMTANKYLQDHGEVDNDLITSAQYEEIQKTKKHLTTGSKALDNLFGGHGIETRTITEFYGKNGASKSQVCFTLAVLGARSEEEGGFGGNVLYVDVEGTYSPERISEIIKERGLDPAIRNRILLIKPRTSAMFSFKVKNLGMMVRDHNIRLIVIDSIIALHRQEFLGRENLATRQQQLAEIMNRLLKIAEMYNLAVVISNQIVTNPDGGGRFGGNPDIPVGGNVIGHSSNNRVYLQKLTGRIKARMVKSPKYADQECEYIITEKGVEDKKDYIDKTKPLKGRIPEMIEN